MGDETWSYKKLVPYLKKAERHFEAKRNPGNRGSNGPIRVTSVARNDPKRKYGLREPIRAAWEELILRLNPNGDCGSLAGVCELLEHWDDGQRQPSYAACSLKPSNIITGATVRKVIFIRNGQGDHTASSVVLTDGRQLKAQKEIILSAGATKTPQILMLSGIGPTNLLSKYNIAVISDNPEVASNYFDHLALFQVWKVRDPEKGLSMGTLTLGGPSIL